MCNRRRFRPADLRQSDRTANTIRAALPGLRLTGGRLMIVGSGAGLIGLYGYAAYCATKSALVGLADSLRLELASDRISVGLCYPPDTETPQLAQERPLRPAEAEIMMGKVAAWPARPAGPQNPGRDRPPRAPNLFHAGARIARLNWAPACGRCSMRGSAGGSRPPGGKGFDRRARHPPGGGAVKGHGLGEADLPASGRPGNALELGGR